MKTLKHIAEFLKQDLADSQPGLVIKGLSLSSADIQPGWAFVAIQGANSHGGIYWPQAKQRGAVCVISDQYLNDCDLPVLKVADLKTQFAELAGWFYGYPSQKIKLIGITGTNGKTSTTHYIAQLLEYMGHGCGVLGTLGNGRINNLQPTNNTTLDVIALNSWLADFVQQGLAYAVLEVSSHAIALGRIKGLHFACVGLTQVTRDHLDFHLDIADYHATKKRLFEAFPADNKILNLDDKIGQQLAKQQIGNVVTYSQKNPDAQIYIQHVQLTEQGVEGVICYKQVSNRFLTQLIGQFTIENILCSISALCALGFRFTQLVEGLAELQPIDGRMQKICCQKADVTVLVDYAHTPDALEQVLLSVAAHRPKGEVWLVFGCGGDRDPGKRPLMAEIAERLADRIILTDDNPRYEEPNQIVADICQGFSQPNLDKLSVLRCRKTAIETALEQAKTGDWVVVVGKGHEQFQEIQGVKIPFSDQQVITTWQSK